MAIEAIGQKINDSDFKLPMDNKLVADAVHSGDLKRLHKVLVDYGLVIQDYEEFAKSQHMKYMSMVQYDASYVNECMVAPPTMMDMIDQNPYFYMTQEDLSLANSMFEEVLGVEGASSGGGKGMSVGKSMSVGGGGAKGMSAGKGVAAMPTLSEMNSDASGLQNFYDSVLAPRIFQAQFDQAMNQKSEFENQLRKLLMMARDGTLEDPAILLLALAKFNCEKAGKVSVWGGYGIQVEMDKQNRVVNAWRGGDQSYASTQMLNLDLKKSTQSVTDFTQLVQSAAKFSETWSTMVKTSMESMHNTKMEIVRRMGL